jgi:2-polyprenyl-3-methyl-5-hydroxy-6-metoxy-1,4-benzoquinol methylase
MPISYDPLLCNLCGSRDAVTLIDYSLGRGMTSDSRIVRRNLRKVQCVTCGLVRDGLPFAASDLEQHYSTDYRLNTSKSGEEHVFYLPGGAMARSRLIHDWILTLKPHVSWKSGIRVLEVGCGQGSLLSQLRGTFPSGHFVGIDLSAEAVALAVAKGLDVRQGGMEILGSEEFDIVIAFGVLEHVPSPTMLLTDMRELLEVGGEVIVGQPMQDVPSYDVFFVDHLHHFTTEHVQSLAEKAGFTQMGLLAGHPSIHNFSLHHLQKSAFSASTPRASWKASRCSEAIAGYGRVFSDLDHYLTTVNPKDRIAVFGTGEVFTLLYTYSNLPSVHIICGLDDNDDRRANHSWPFPVVTPDEAKAFRPSTVLLCVNTMYNRPLLKRLLNLGLHTINVRYISETLGEGWVSAQLAS